MLLPLALLMSLYPAVQASAAVRPQIEIGIYAYPPQPGICMVCPEGSEWWNGYGYGCIGPNGARGACWSEEYPAAPWFQPDPGWPGWFAGCPAQCGGFRH